MEDLLRRRGLFRPLFSLDRDIIPHGRFRSVVVVLLRPPFGLVPLRPARTSAWSPSEVRFSREPPTPLFFPTTDNKRSPVWNCGSVCVCTCRPRKHAILLRLYSLSGSVMENHPRGISRYCAARAWSPFPRSGVSICRQALGFCSNSENFCVYIFFELGLHAKLYKSGVNKMGSFLRKVLAVGPFFVLADFYIILLIMFFI